MPLSEAQQVLNSFASFTATSGGKEFTIHGKRGTLLALGVTPTALATDLGSTGVSRTVSRPSSNRSRWLGDTQGTSVSGTTANVMFYPGRTGNALPGRPFRFSQAGDTYVNSEGKTVPHKWTLSIEGPWGAFVSYLIDNRPPADTTLYTPTGKRHIPDIQAD
jgi:hypothetical protein